MLKERRLKKKPGGKENESKSIKNIIRKQLKTNGEVCLPDRVKRLSKGIRVK